MRSPGSDTCRSPGVMWYPAIINFESNRNMKPNNRIVSLLVLIAFCLLAVIGLPLAQDRTGGNDFGQPQIGMVKGKLPLIPKVQIVDRGTVIYEGEFDLNPTLRRIRSGRKLPHRNDGSIFGNREKLLPKQRDRQFYREFVVKKTGLPFPGPQRMIVGKQGEVYFTGDHYASFLKVN